ncbi:MAG: hypothetical protein ACLQVI_06720 [Polyangiaceae bacterium]|jgi:hypothetical protein
MILFNPPVAAPYIPASQKIAKVYGSIQRDEGLDLLRVQLVLLDTNGKRISPDPNAIPVPRFTPQQIAAVVASTSTQAKDTLDQALSRALLPIVDANLGLQGGVVE